MSLKDMKTGTSKEAKTNRNVARLRDLLSENHRVNKETVLRMKVGIEGEAKTGKTGLAMDTDKKVFYLDCDGRAIPTWKINYESTDKIVIFNPVVRNENGDIDPYETQGNIRSFIGLVEEEISKGEDIRFVWDGTDTWLKWCTLYMTGMENARMRSYKPARQNEWHERNQPYHSVLDEALELNCEQVYITHMKAPFQNNPAQPNWNKLDFKLHSIITTNQISSMKGIEYNAFIRSSNFNTKLVGQRLNFLTVSKNGDIDWKGLEQLRNGTL